MVNQDLIILHGWQSKIQRWDPLKKRLEKNFAVFCPSLPGFGDNRINRGWNLADYSDWLKEYLKKNKIKNPIILAHSFGGRVAVKYLASGGKANQLVLIASSGLKNPQSLKLILFKLLAKTGKLIFTGPIQRPARWFLYKLAREKDYYQANVYQKETMKKILQDDILPILPKIKVPTLILWGQNDKYTPVAGACIFQKNIKNSILKIYSQAGHDLPFKQSDQVSQAVIKFCRQ